MLIMCLESIIFKIWLILAPVLYCVHHAAVLQFDFVLFRMHPPKFPVWTLFSICCLRVSLHFDVPDRLPPSASFTCVDSIYFRHELTSERAQQHSSAVKLWCLCFVFAIPVCLDPCDPVDCGNSVPPCHSEPVWRNDLVSRTQTVTMCLH